MFYRLKSSAIDHGAIWAIALPAMITNVATALIGVGDMWIVGRLGDAPTQGAVDVGARLFAVLFVVMNFLKTGTTALVAQEGTRAGEEAQTAVLARGLVTGLAIAAMLLLTKPVLQPLMLSLLGAEGAVLESARIYADIRYWTAPGVMLNLALVGYLVGRRQMFAVLVFEIGYNLLNVGLGLWMVLELGWGIEGVAWSSFIAEYAKLVAVWLFVSRGAWLFLVKAFAKGTAFSWHGMKPFLSVNRDLFLRTLVLMVTLASITRISAGRGPEALAANGIIYQLFVLTALLLDGFENAAQVLNGERKGANDRAGFSEYTRAILKRGIAVAAGAALFFEIFADPVLASFAATPEVARIAQDLNIWLVVIPFAGVVSFVFDGVFVGASWTRAMLLSMAGAAAIYAMLVWLTWPMGSDGLWLSFVVFLAARATLQLALMPRLMKRDFA